MVFDAAILELGQRKGGQNFETGLPGWCMPSFEEKLFAMENRSQRSDSPEGEGARGEL